MTGHYRHHSRSFYLLTVSTFSNLFTLTCCSRNRLRHRRRRHVWRRWTGNSRRGRNSRSRHNYHFRCRRTRFSTSDSGRWDSPGCRSRRLWRHGGRGVWRQMVQGMLGRLHSGMVGRLHSGMMGRHRRLVDGVHGLEGSYRRFVVM